MKALFGVPRGWHCDLFFKLKHLGMTEVLIEGNGGGAGFFGPALSVTVLNVGQHACVGSHTEGCACHSRGCHCNLNPSEPSGGDAVSGFRDSDYGKRLNLSLRDRGIAASLCVILLWKVVAGSPSVADDDVFGKLG